MIKQLALILPSNVYFNSLTGSAGGGEGGSEGIAGPSLTIAGCAPDQDAVAGFVASLKEIDGVTRVELKQSQVTESSGEGGATGASSCAIGRKAQFQIIVAFDEAPPSPDSSAGQAEAAEAESSTPKAPNPGAPKPKARPPNPANRKARAPNLNRAAKPRRPNRPRRAPPAASVGAG